ncbi:MAG: hypothetical protein ACLU38_09750 [Dysosmobacter sp.]
MPISSAISTTGTGRCWSTSPIRPARQRITWCGTPDVPEPVLAAAKATVQKAYQDYKNGGYDSGADLDDWRVEYVSE